MLTYAIPGASPIEVTYLVLDLNGTLTDGGRLIAGVGDRLTTLARDVEIHVVTADTHGSAARTIADLPVSLSMIERGDDKAALLDGLDPTRTVAIGNGRNDAAMLRAAAIGIAVIGPEGAAGPAILAADVVCRSIVEALDLLLADRRLASTLRP